MYSIYYYGDFFPFGIDIYPLSEVVLFRFFHCKPFVFSSFFHSTLNSCYVRSTHLNWRNVLPIFWHRMYISEGSQRFSLFWHGHWFWCPFDILLIMCFCFLTFLLSCIAKLYRLMLHISSTYPRIHHFSQGPLLLLSWILQN